MAGLRVLLLKNLIVAEFSEMKTFGKKYSATKVPIYNSGTYFERKMINS